MHVIIIRSRFVNLLLTVHVKTSLNVIGLSLHKNIQMYTLNTLFNRIETGGFSECFIAIHSSYKITNFNHFCLRNKTKELHYP